MIKLYPSEKGLMALIFLSVFLIILKVTGVASISWFWALFPIWIFPVIFASILCLIICIGIPALILTWVAALML